MTEQIEKLIQGMSSGEINWLKSNIDLLYTAIATKYFEFKNANPDLFEKGKKIEIPIKQYLAGTMIKFFYPKQIGDASNCFWLYFAYLEHDGYLENSEKRKVRIKQNEYKGVIWIFATFMIWIDTYYHPLNQIHPKVLMYFLNMEKIRRKEEKLKNFRAP